MCGGSNRCNCTATYTRQKLLSNVVLADKKYTTCLVSSLSVPPKRATSCAAGAMQQCLFPVKPESLYLHVSNCLPLAHSLVLGLVSCHNHKQFVVVAALSIASHLRSRKQPWPSVVDVVRQPRTMCHVYASVAAVRHHPAWHQKSPSNNRPRPASRSSEDEPCTGSEATNKHNPSVPAAFLQHRPIYDLMLHSACGP
ncbi:hypothetical protein CH63R_10835 [Colletotrichum higginsianum IMI 349063]|uniref:Uncharacterized protein n=1 Tax=Colletotrichum higginsianum (strain IMI 349063) TaxID=759273 RepID=A0A1B7Y424_COLHI|nr:uncharacterized protein CH63R_10835 [Colletotrichum higginsianum IMI 349063]OBR06715.1 hypothetical protein CH63R_10835 [Colletotrichum higginsianum IMI 349063]